jgi:hypothetical protein
MYTDVGGLAGIGKKKTGICISKPTNLDSTPTESSNVCKEGFHTGKGEQNPPKAAPPFVLIADEVVKCVKGVECLQDAMVITSDISSSSQIKLSQT